MAEATSSTETRATDDMHRPGRVAITLVAAAALLFGMLTLSLQEHFTTALSSGEDLGPVTSLLADGSGLRTVWPGWGAAILFTGAALRLRLGPAEPPVGGERDSVTAMRAALRTEHRLVHRAWLAVSVVAALDCGRALVYLIAAADGPGVARDAWPSVLAETAGLGLASLALWWWTTLFRAQLDRIGAL